MPEVETLATPINLNNLLASCPNSWQGDTGFANWVTQACNVATAAVPQTAAPVITSISPTKVPANRNATISIVGTGLDTVGPKVIVSGTSLTPQGGGTATASSVIVPAAQIPNSGTFVQLYFQNTSATGPVSNAVNLFVL
jgi:hypothetical protein